MTTRLCVSRVCLVSVCVLLTFVSVAIRRASVSFGKPPIMLQAGQLIINEYLADPAGSTTGDLAGDANGDGRRDSADDEFIELVNAGSEPIDVSGFTISDSAAVRFTFPSGKAIPPSEAAVIFGGGTPTGSFGSAATKGLVFIAGGAGLSLNNGGDSIVMKNAGGAIVSSLSFGAAEGGANQSITRSPDITGGFVPHSSAAGSSGSLFSPGTRVDGRLFPSPDPIVVSISPDSVVTGAEAVSIAVTGSRFQEGARIRIDNVPVATDFQSEMQLNGQIPSALTRMVGVHSVTVENPDSRISNSVNLTILSEIGINEYLADPPDGEIGDANGDGERDSAQDEFIELINRTDRAVDIGAISLGDAAQVRFRFPANTVLPAGEAAVVFGGGSPRGEFGNAGVNGLVFTASLSLNNAGDTMMLRDAGGNLLESIVFGPAEGNVNQSINRDPESTGTRLVAHASIAAAAGRLFSPGARIDGRPFTIGPRIMRIVPDRVIGGTPGAKLSVFGTGFEPGTVVFVGVTAADTLSKGDELDVMIPDRVINTPGEHTVVAINESGNRSNAVLLTVVPPAPILNLVLPRFIQAGSGESLVALFGLNFQPSATAIVDGSAVSTASLKTGELLATIPVSVTAILGTHSVRVRNPDGQESGELSLIVVPVKPRITGLAPDQIFAGSPAFNLMVRGTAFNRNANVLIDGKLLSTSFVSETELLAQVAADLVAAPGTRAVSVENPDGVVSDEIGLRVLPVPPVIRFISPDSMTEGEPGFSLAVAGEKFQPGAVIRLIENQRPGVALQTRFLSDARLDAAVPASLITAPGRLLMRAENPDSGASNVVALSVLIRDGFVINEFLPDPPEGIAGDANGDGTRSTTQDEFVELVNRTLDALDISGYKLFDSTAVRHVFAAGTIVPPFESVVVFGGGRPNGPFGNTAENNLVLVASSGGLSLANTGDIIRLEDSAGKTIQEVQYGSAEGNAGESINRDPDLNGGRFSRHSQVAGNPSALYSPGAKSGGQPFSTVPRINALSPDRARAGSEEVSLTVTGSNFLPGVVVLFGETELEATWHSEAELACKVPGGLLQDGGALNIRVRNPRGETSKAGRFLVVADPPVIKALAPDKIGTGAEAVQIRISGQGFQQGSKVTIGNETVDSIFTGASTVTAHPPVSLFTRAATLEIILINADENRSNPIQLIVENGPLITRLMRSRVKAGRGDVDISLGGVAFQRGVIVLINGQAARTRFLSGTALEVLVSSSLTEIPGRLLLQALNPDGGRSNRVAIQVVR